MPPHLSSSCSSASRAFSSCSCSSMTCFIQAASARACSRRASWTRCSSSSFSRSACRIRPSASWRKGCGHGWWGQVSSALCSDRGARRAAQPLLHVPQM